ncbi:MAG: hypothetical protein ACKOEC_06900 [Acidimicrobiia bacterium]
MTVATAVATVRRRNDFKLPAIEGMGGISHLENCATAFVDVRVVERGINIDYRSTAFHTRNS